MASSRVIVKGIPRHATEQRLREHFSTFGEVTDCRLKVTKDGISRKFGFVGYRNPEEAREAVKNLNRSFFDTAKITVEVAHAPGSKELSRAWSRYTPGTSAYAKRNPVPEAKAKASAKTPLGKRRVASRPSVPEVTITKDSHGSRAVTKSVAVDFSKAGVSNQRVHTEFASSDEEDADDEDADTSIAKEDRTGRLAFDEDMDDMAYLRARARGNNGTSTGSTAQIRGRQLISSAPAVGASSGTTGKKADEAPAGKKLRKKRKARSAGAVAGAEAETQVDADEANKAEVQNSAEAKGLPQDTSAAAVVSEGANAFESDFANEADREELETSGRLYVTNIPYGATEDEVRTHFEPLGEVSSVHLVKDEDTLKSRGFAYISYVFPECAVRALSELDLRSFQGRLLRLSGARARPPPPDVESTAPRGGGTSSYKRKLAEKKKAEAHMEHTWNLLYVSANAATDVAAKQLGIAKGELMGKDSENAAVTAALTETSLIQQTKRWLEREGIRVDAFEQKGTSMASSRAVVEGDRKRRQDTFIVKHLPAGASVQELRERFARYGELVRCSLAPSGTVAVAQYAEGGAARHAFQKLAFSKYRHAPLYLEWAPDGVFVEGAADRRPAARDGDDASDAEARKEEAEEEDQDEGSTVVSLFVKNLNFSTTDELLKAAFRGCKGLRSATVMRKKAAVDKNGAKPKDDAKGQSMGYGFVEFSSAAAANEALKRKQGVNLQGHALQLQISQRGTTQQGGRGDSKATKKFAGVLPSPRLCVRNLAFEATRQELRQLFAAYGTVTAVRIPKKSNLSGHRGFAFIDFASKAEAAAAFEALQHTHLYGRRLVIEAAEEKANDVGTAQQTAQKRQTSRALRSEATKRRRTGVLNASAGGEAFEDALAV